LLPSTKYWIAIVTNAAITLTVSGDTKQIEMGLTQMGLPSWNAGVATYTGTDFRAAPYVSHSFGALPNPFGAPTGTWFSPLLGVQVV
jgi:hypothetical protein